MKVFFAPQKNRPSLIEFKCLACSRPFWAYRRPEQSKYCSRPCQRAHAYAHLRKPENPTTATCTKCGINKTADQFYSESPTKLRSQCKQCVRRSTPVAHRRSHLKIRFGITLEEWFLLYDKQGGVCPICSKPLPNKDSYTQWKGRVGANQFATDHCHKTGQVRGILHSHCNRALGFLNDDPIAAEGAAEYLRKWKSITDQKYPGAS